MIADEPTTALDVTVQKQILGLLRELVDERGMALLLISHDLGVIARSVARMMVMYGGSVVESGPTAKVFAQRRHPYTQGLFGARPALLAPRGQRLLTIPGTVPELADLPAGCAFAGRCAYVVPACHHTTAQPRAPTPPPGGAGGPVAAAAPVSAAAGAGSRKSGVQRTRCPTTWAAR